MAVSGETSVEQYLAGLPDDRRDAISAVRAVVLENLPEGMVETMAWGMISYEVPLEIYPDTYNNKPLSYAALASQKNHMALYLHAIYADDEKSEWFRARYVESGLRMDMGKSCVRFKKLEHLPLDLVGEAIGATDLPGFIAQHSSS